MQKVRINASRAYDVIIGRGLLANASELIPEITLSTRLLIVTDVNVAGFWLPQLKKSLSVSGNQVESFKVPAGEISKSTETYISLLEFLAQRNYSRSDIILALGGGVIGDLAGFAAATYLRGIKWVQIPTSLLAMTDSSVGGKTGVNLRAGKNLAGAFYQPMLVICDTDNLSTLPEDIYIDGCAEIIKYGIVNDRELYDIYKDGKLSERIDDAITRCVSIKGALVEKDEFDCGDRMLLNFGHTIGHAIEAASGYTISHGRAVSAGMAIITKAAVYHGLCSKECLSDLLDVLHLYNLPTSSKYTADILSEYISHDKKISDGTLNIVIPSETGHGYIYKIKAEDFSNFIKPGIES